MYLERELGWPQVRWYGWVKRQRKRWRSGEWSEEEVVWISRRSQSPGSSVSGHVVTGR
jgi:hypothetical protein